MANPLKKSDYYLAVVCLRQAAVHVDVCVAA